MADIIEDNFKERKSLEDIFLEYRPYSLKETLIALNVNNKEDDESDSLDDEIIAIDLNNKKVQEGIDAEIEDNS